MSCFDGQHAGPFEIRERDAKAQVQCLGCFGGSGPTVGIAQIPFRVREWARPRQLDLTLTTDLAPRCYGCLRVARLYPFERKDLCADCIDRYVRSSKVRDRAPHVVCVDLSAWIDRQTAITGG